MTIVLTRRRDEVDLAAVRFDAALDGIVRQTKMLRTDTRRIPPSFVIALGLSVGFLLATAPRRLIGTIATGLGRLVLMSIRAATRHG